LVVAAPFDAWPEGEDNRVEDELPKQRVFFDHAGVGQKFLEVTPHREEVGGLGRSEIHDQDADAAALGARLFGSAQSRGIGGGNPGLRQCRHSAARSNAADPDRNCSSKAASSALASARWRIFTWPKPRI